MKRDELFERRILAQVHAGKSFSSAARAFGITVSTVTRTIQRIEADLGVRLFARTARGIRPTEAGILYLAHVERVLSGEAEARACLQEISAGKAGTLRLTVPVFVAEHILPDAIAAFAEEHPQVRIDVHAGDDLIDLSSGGFDLAVRAGPLADSSLRARKLIEYPLVIAAAPALLRGRPPLTHPSQLASWPILGFGRTIGPVKWTFRRGGERVPLELTPLFRSNNLEFLLALTARGLGLAMVPSIVVPPRLTCVLEPWCERLRGTLYAVHPDNPGKARVRADFLRALSTTARDHLGIALD